MKKIIYFIIIPFILFSCEEKINWLEPTEVQPLLPENNTEVKIDFFKPDQNQLFTWKKLPGASYTVVFSADNAFDSLTVKMEVGSNDTLSIKNSDLIDILKQVNPDFNSAGRFFWKLEQSLQGETKSCWRYFNGIISIEKFTDDRDNEEYKVSQIVTSSGELITIMAENLRSQVYSDGSELVAPLKWAPENMDATRRSLIGAYYSWPTVVRDVDEAWEKARNGDKIQGICPDGWHVATMDEWKEIRDALGALPATKVKSNEFWTVNSEITNETGLSVLPSGYYWNETMNELSDQDVSARIWTATPALEGNEYSWGSVLTDDVDSEASTVEIYDNEGNEIDFFHRAIQGGNNNYCVTRCVMN